MTQPVPLPIAQQTSVRMLSSVAGDEHGWEQWKWDETLFAGSAPFYLKGRMPYAEGLANAMAEALDLDGHGRLLDVGCGPGVVALRLAHLYDEVGGLDPDPDMIKEASRLAEELDVANAKWVCMRAEDLSEGLGTFRTVTFAASFHWMDRPKVAALVKNLLENSGAVVQIDAPSYRADTLAEASTGDLPHPLPPDAAVAELRTRYLGPDLWAGQSIRNNSPDGEDAVFQTAGFPPKRQIVVPDGRVLTRTIDDLVAQRFSSSPTAPHLFGDRLESFEADLRKLLENAAPHGLFSIRSPDNILSIWETPG
jgi:SAM-dependent methyltransferase